ncbi:hypothetical protein UlMin_006222 [Ulmus minor]
MDSELYKAAMIGDESSSFDNLTSTQDSSPPQLTCQGNSILHIAAMSGNKLTVEKILRSNPSHIHQTNLKGDTPLHIAARLGHLEVTDLLVSYGKRPEIVVEVGTNALQMVNLENNTALHEAVKNGFCEIVDLLIKEDPSLTSFINDKGESPLFLAVDRDFYEMSVLMLENVGSDCSWSGRNGMTVMHAAMIRIHDNFQLLKESWWKDSNLYAQFINGFLKHLGQRDPVDKTDFVSKILTRYGHEILEIQDDLGWLPLHYAAYFGNVEVVKLFLRTKKSLAYMKNKDGMSALHISAKNGGVKVIETLLQVCPDVCELLDNRNRTALHVAVESEKSHVVHLFLNMVLFIDQINAKDIEGNTCFHLAAACGSVEILLMLANNSRVEKGAINNVGMTAVDICGSTMQLNDNGKTKPHRLFGRITRRQVSARDVAAAGAGGEGSSDGASNDIVSKTNIYSPKHVKNMANINLLVATILISISFAAGMQMPGGYDDNGMAILRHTSSFKSFLVYNSLAFGCSAASMFIHFMVSFFSRLFREPSTFPLYFVMILTDLSIFWTVMAFVTGTSSVLNQNDNRNDNQNDNRNVDQYDNRKDRHSHGRRVNFQIGLLNVGPDGIVAELSFFIPMIYFIYWFLYVGVRNITSYIRK